MRTRAAPFPQATPDTVAFDVPWHIRLPAGDVPLPDDVPAWDFQATLRLRAVVTVDTAAVRDTCRLGTSTSLLLVVSAGSSATKMRAPVVRRTVEDATPSISLDLDLAGHELGGRLTLDTLLVATGIERVDALSPTADGSILWRHRRAVWLEGEASRFPTEVADLSVGPFFSPGALWFLDVRADEFDAAGLGAVRLVLNEKHPTVVGMLAGDPSPEIAAAMSVLRWDVVRQLVTTALDSDDFVERVGRFEEDTLGAMLAGLIARYWPEESPHSLRRLRRDEPSRFERELQDRAGLFQ